VSGVVELLRDIKTIAELPKVSISLMLSRTSDNDPFFEQLVQRFYDEAMARHRRFPLIRSLQYGVALLRLPDRAADYLKIVESSARRNINKAQRLGYTFSRIDYNLRRREIAEIIRSTPFRQGPMPTELMTGEMPPISDPTSRNPLHDYAYVGISKDGELRAYAGCMVAGELFAITDIYGHSAYQTEGIVPLLLSEIVNYAKAHHPQACYCMYDKYFGASQTLRRFKKKFGFLPHKVEWRLG
jgi:ribosomal protein S18 acetylase RimI-like enzyme